MIKGIAIVTPLLTETSRPRSHKDWLDEIRPHEIDNAGIWTLEFRFVSPVFEQLSYLAPYNMSSEFFFNF